MYSKFTYPNHPIVSAPAVGVHVLVVGSNTVGAVVCLIPDITINVFKCNGNPTEPFGWSSWQAGSWPVATS